MSYDTFHNTGLPSMLPDSVDTLLPAGAFSGRCVLSTAFSAIRYEYFTIMPYDLVVDTQNRPTKRTWHTKQRTPF